MKSPNEVAVEGGHMDFDNLDQINILREKVGVILDEIIELMNLYVDIPEEYKKVIGLWIIGTYVHKEFDTFPFLFINAMKGSGKTRLLKFVSSLSYGSDGKVETGLTESVLFRSGNGTLVLDETEDFGTKERGKLREYLNACYKKGGVVRRNKKIKGKEEDYVIQEFEVYRPIIMANIRGLEDVLEDRCLTLIMEKSGDERIIKKIEDFHINPKFLEIKRRLVEIKCSLCSVVTVKNIVTTWNNYIEEKYNYTTTLNTYNNITTLTTQDEKLIHIFNKMDETGITGRHLELVYPSLILSSFIDDFLFNQILEIMKEIIRLKQTDEFVENWDVSLIEFVSTFENLNQEYRPVKEICEQFRSFKGLGEKEDENINPKWVGNSLKRNKLIVNKKRKNRGMEVKLDVKKAREKIKLFKTPELKGGSP